MNTHSTTDRQRHRSPDNGAASDVRQSVASSNNYNQKAATLPAVSLTTSSFGRALRDHDHGQDAGLGTTWTANARTLEGVTVDASQISRLFLAYLENHSCHFSANIWQILSSFPSSDARCQRSYSSRQIFRAVASTLLDNIGNRCSIWRCSI